MHCHRTSNALHSLVRRKQKCLQQMPKAVLLTARSLKLSGSEFHTNELATEKAYRLSL